jgi:hypothetical protein
MLQMLFRTLLTLALLPGWTNVGRAQQERGAPPNSSDLSRFVPPKALLVKRLDIDFGGAAGLHTVLAFATESGPDITTGIRVVHNGATVFEESDNVTNGAGPASAIQIDKLTARGGNAGVIVILKSSAAGTASNWHILAIAGKKISRLNPDVARLSVLKQKGYQDWGYNGVTVNGDSIVETQPGYSRETARCCPDRPTIEMLFRFTGGSLLLDKVSELNSTPAKP